MDVWLLRLVNIVDQSYNLDVGAGDLQERCEGTR